MSGKAKNELLEWAKNTKRRSGPVCSTCLWWESMKSKGDIIADLEAVLRQIYRGELQVSVAALARRLKSQYGYTGNPARFAEHLRSHRPDLTALAMENDSE